MTLFTGLLSNGIVTDKKKTIVMITAKHMMALYIQVPVLFGYGLVLICHYCQYLFGTCYGPPSFLHVLLSFFQFF